MKKVTLVKTDDPEKPKLTLTVTGAVIKVVQIEPRSIHLKGNPGDVLETIVKVTPLEKYKFSILGIEQQANTKIKASLIAPKKDEQSWQIKVNVSSDKPEQLYDKFVLKTDSKYRPSIVIRAYAIFYEKQKTGS